MLIDSHCHLTDARFDEDREAVLLAAGAAGLSGVVTVASDAADSAAVARLIAEQAKRATGPRLWGTSGIHPHEAARTRPGDLDRVKDLARPDAGIVAIGETGLDFFYDNAPRDVQTRLFRQQISLAADLGLPLVVHARSADDEMRAILGEVGSDVTGVLHCFTGGPELLEAGLEAGWYVSFSGIVSFKGYHDAHLVRRVPSDRLLVETDAPYLAPHPQRGKRNEPAFVAHVARAVAELRGEDPAALAGTTAANTARFYGLDAGGFGW